MGQDEDRILEFHLGPPHGGQGLGCLDHPLQVEQLGLKLMFMWDAGTADSGLTHNTTMPALRFYFKNNGEKKWVTQATYYMILCIHNAQNKQICRDKVD